MEKTGPPSETSLKGHIERITYHNTETHFVIARFRTAKPDNLITILGTLPNPNPGEVLRVTGVWENHPRYGEQLKIDSFEVLLPATVDGIRKYLESGFVKGIGPKTAARMVNHFGGETLDVIENHPERLTEVRGVGPTLARQIGEVWNRHGVMRGLIRFLQELGIKTSFSSPIFNIYGLDSLTVIQESPYRLVEDLPGIGFQIADAVSQKMGLPADEPERVQACVSFQLNRGADAGHVFLHADQLAMKSLKQFGISGENTREALDELADRGDIVIEDDPDGTGNQAVYLGSLHRAETGIAGKIRAMLSVPVEAPEMAPGQITAAVVKKLAIALSEQQLQALEGILSHRIAIITGGPGTGKTTLVRAVAAIFETLGRQILLAAPTGRAARRLSEVVGKKAETIHKLLGFNPKTGLFDKNQDNPLHADGIIIDEASMVDTLLMDHLVKAIHMSSHLILVGDIFQLPSVGPGNILSDLMRSERIETFELKDIFRQAKKSRIIVNAHSVRRGESLDPMVGSAGESIGNSAGDPNGNSTDAGDFPSEFRFLEHHRPESVVKAIVKACLTDIPAQLNLDPVKDIQIITPMHRGAAGTLNLNQVLQGALNPNPVGLKVFDTVFKIGDKAMHLVNNYTKEVFNGDIGTVATIDKEKESIIIDYDGRQVPYDFTELNELVLAYAITVHKSQGSEYPAVIVPLTTQHFPLLQRNLLYTAITRGRQTVYLVGSPKALRIALNNDKSQRRLSGLARRLRSVQEG